MAMRFSEVFGWLRIPFTFGGTCSHESEDEPEHRRMNRESDGTVLKTTYNGQVSAVQLFLVMVVVSGVQLFSSFTSDLVDRTPTRVVQTAYMTVGLVVMIGVYRKRQKLLFVATISDLTGTLRERDRDDVTVAGIITFYLMGTVYDLVHIISVSFSCPEVWTVCRDSYFYAQDMVHITYHVVRIIYLACQTLFCMIFNHSYFLDRSLTRHGLMVLQAVNISLWFHEVVQSFVSDVYGKHHSTQERGNRFAAECLLNVTNSSLDFASCLGSNSTVAVSYDYTKKYGNAILRPFNIEYSLLVGKCLARWFITCRAMSMDSVDAPTTEERRLEDSPIGTETQSDDDGAAAAAAAAVPGSHLSNITEAGRGRRRGYTEESADDGGSFPPIVPTPRSRGVPAASQSLTVILLVVSIIVNLLNAVFVFLPRIPQTLLGPSLRFESTIAIAPCYSCFYYTLLIFVIAAGYHISRYFRVLRDSPFGGLDYLLLFTSSGNLAYNLFRLLGAVGSNQKGSITSETINAFYAGYVLLEVIETSFQVSFSLYAGRLRIGKRDGGMKPILFRAIILFLALCNLTMWIIQTFAVRVISQSLLVDYLGPNGWPLISNILKPFYLFFRFNSFLLFIRIYRRIRKQSH